MKLRIVWVFVFLASGISAVAQLPASHPKVLQTEAVIRRLATAFGMDLLQLPKLVMYHKKKSGEGRIAYLETFKKPYILAIDEELFDVCEQISPQNHSALAFVVAHELAHMALNHPAHRSFAEKENLPKSISLSLSVQQEEKADLTGLQYAYLAGYDPEATLPQLFTKLYKTYELKDDNPGYPSKKARITQTKLKATQFRSEAYLFSVGQVLYCRQNYPEAAQCFGKIVQQEMPTKETLNNLGLCWLQQAIALKNDYITDYFVLPFEFDPRNRLLRLNERSDDSQQILWRNYLDKAQEAFEKAIKLDPDYTAALQNKAIGAILVQNYYEALGVLKNIQDRLKQKPSANVLTIRAIAFCGLQMWTDAEQSFTAARKMNAFQAAHNQNVFLQIKADPTLKKLRGTWKTIQPKQKNQIGCSALPPLFSKVESVAANYPFPRSTELLQEVNPKLTIKIAPFSNPIQALVIRSDETLLLKAAKPN